jgi:deazaflavin-dependent oxidoreductase (nitroreductase family)
MTGNFDYKNEFLYLTTTGRKSGLPREIEIWFVAYDGCYYLCSEKRFEADWVQNIRQNPEVSFWVEGYSYRGRGRPVDPATEPELSAALAQEFDAKYRWSDGLMVELCPTSSS